MSETLSMPCCSYQSSTSIAKTTTEATEKTARNMQQQKLRKSKIKFWNNFSSLNTGSKRNQTVPVESTASLFPAETAEEAEVRKYQRKRSKSKVKFWNSFSSSNTGSGGGSEAVTVGSAAPSFTTKTAEEADLSMHQRKPGKSKIKFWNLFSSSNNGSGGRSEAVPVGSAASSFTAETAKKADLSMHQGKPSKSKVKFWTPFSSSNTGSVERNEAVSVHSAAPPLKAETTEEAVVSMHQWKLRKSKTKFVNLLSLLDTESERMNEVVSVASDHPLIDRIPLKKIDTEKFVEPLVNNEPNTPEVLNASSQTTLKNSDKSVQCNLVDVVKDVVETVKKIDDYISSLKLSRVVSQNQSMNSESLNKDNDSESPKCSVCLDSYPEILKKRAHVVALNCRHKFCNFCVNVFKRSRKCPMCRARITKIMYFRSKLIRVLVTENLN